MGKRTAVAEKTPHTAIKLRGFFRVNVMDADDPTKVVGDSGFIENQITDLGVNQYVMCSLGSLSGSKYLTHAALGTGTAINATHTNLNGDVTSVRAALTIATTGGTAAASHYLYMTAQFAAGWFTTAGNYNISNVGLFNTSASATGTMFCGNTFTSSTCASNQAVNLTYYVTG